MDRKIAIQTAQIRQMFSTSHITQATSVILAAILSYVLRDVNDTTTVIEWFSVITLVALSRTALAFAYQSSLQNIKSSHFWLTGFRFGVLASGVVWGGVSILLFPANNIQYEVVIVSMLCGLSAGGLVSYAVDLPSGIVYIVSVLAPLIIRLARVQNSITTAMAIALLLYLCFMIMSVRYMSRSLAENIRMHLDAAEREEAVRVSEQQFRLLLNHSPVGIFHYDTQFVITYCNDRLAEIVHNSAELTVGVDIKSLSDQLIMPTLKKALDGELCYYEGYYFASSNNNNVWIAITCAPSFDKNGDIEGGVAIVQDISERIKTEQALHKESEKNLALLQNSSDGIHILDTEGNITEASNAFCAMLGYQRSEIIGLNVSRWDANFSSDTLKQILSQQSTFAAPTRFETKHRRKDGSIIDVEVNGYWLELYGKKLLFYSSRDITERKQAQDQIQLLMNEQKAILDNAIVGIIKLQNRVIVWTNCVFDDMFGFEHGELNGSSTRQIFPTQKAFDEIGEVYPVLRAGGHYRGEQLFQRKDGSLIWTDISGVLLDNSKQEALWAFFDISERKSAENALHESEQRFRHFFEKNSSVMLLVEPASGKIINANEAAVAYYGYPVNQLIGMHIGKINTLSPEHIAEEIKKANLEERNYFIFTHRLASGDIRNVEVHSTPIESENRSLLLSIIHDITERTEMEEQVYHLAFYDSLTKLPNRRLLNDRLGQTLAASKRNGYYGALIFLDLDNFKPLNDTYGHSVGDLLLIEAALRISNCVRETDTASRFGGDEFVVILSELEVDKDESIAQAQVVAEKIRTSLALPYLLQTHKEGQAEYIVKHHCTSSIGVVIFKGQQASLDELFKWADIAMYQAKSDGRNLIRFYDSKV